MNKIFIIFYCIIIYCYAVAQTERVTDSIILVLQDTIESQDVLKVHPFEKYMEFVRPKSTIQGGACWGKYLFVGHDRNPYMDIYDMVKKEYVCMMSMNTPNPKSKCHANTINFGCHYYKRGDEIPLLYVSSGYSVSDTIGKCNTFVYRITKNIDRKDSIVFKSELVQTISVVGSIRWSETILDNEHEAIWIRYDNNLKRRYLKYHSPDIRQKDVVLDLRLSSAIDTINIDNFRFLRHNQGGLCYNGDIYVPSGVPGWGEDPYLTIINLDRKDYQYIVNLYNLDMFNPLNLRDNTWEPEFVFVYQDDFYIGYRSAVYKLNMDLVKTANYFYNIYYR